MSNDTTITIEQYIEEVSKYLTVLRQAPGSMKTMIAAGQCIQRDSEDQDVKTQVFLISEALKNMERITLIEMFNISESLRKLERLQHATPEPEKAEPEIADPDADLPKV